MPEATVGDLCFVTAAQYVATRARKLQNKLIAAHSRPSLRRSVAELSAERNVCVVSSMAVKPGMFGSLGFRVPFVLTAV